MNINGYQLLRNDRCDGRRGGGVAIYCKKYLQIKVIDFLANDIIESVNLEIKSRNTKILVSCVYNPERCSNFSPFFHALSNLVVNYDYVICCGDFNVNLLSNETTTSNFLNLLSLAALSVVNSTIPTRFCKNNIPSLLDYFAVSDMSKVLFFNQIGFISDHDLIFCSFDVSLMNVDSADSYVFRNYANIDYTALFADVMTTPWNDCWLFSNVNDKVSFFVDCVKTLLDAHVPICERRIMNKACPWYNTTVKQAIKKRGVLYTKWKRNPSTINWTAFKLARNEVVRIVRNSKARYCSSRLSTSLPPKVLWNNLKKFGICDNKKSNCNLDPCDVNDYFVSACNSMTVQYYNNICNINVTSRFEFSVVTEGEIIRKFQKISSNATGSDGIPIKFLKIILPYIIAPITHIVNFCITTSVFPSAWKDAIVIPTEKNLIPLMLMITDL